MNYSLKDVKLIRLASIPWGCLLLNGISFPFLTHKGLSVSEVFFIQSVLAFSIVITQVPSGLFTDKFGIKKALVLAGIFKGIGGIMAWAMEGFVPMMIAWFFIGLANSFYSGTNVSVIYRSYLSQGKKTDFISNIYQWGNFSFYISIFLGSWIAKYSMELAALINGLVACTPALIFSFISNDSRFKEINRETNKKQKTKKSIILLLLILKVFFLFRRIKGWFCFYFLYLECLILLLANLQI
ncbi:MFS transporter [Xenorhabdus sp. TH1]|uniref:MFS transporter n=1 Tax=Xenorhabdus sp. TH1 TaxID=3130166 RepID=UPI0030CB15FF